MALRGAGGGWRLAEGFRTNLTGLKAEEIRTLRQDAEYVRERIHVDGAGWHQADESVPYLSTVQEAIWQERKLSISYRRESSVVERIVHPLGLVAKRSTWYQVAEVEGELRTYRISRLQHAAICEEPFTRPAGFDLARYWAASTAHFLSNLPRYPARIRVEEHALPRLRRERYLHIKSTQPERNGWVLADVLFETRDSACEIALGYGAQMYVIEPEELQERIKQAASRILALYAPAPASAPAEE